jgi:hypothetical protein
MHVAAVNIAASYFLLLGGWTDLLFHGKTVSTRMDSAEVDLLLGMIWWSEVLSWRRIFHYGHACGIRQRKPKFDQIYKFSGNIPVDRISFSTLTMIPAFDSTFL